MKRLDKYDIAIIVILAILVAVLTVDLILLAKYISKH